MKHVELTEREAEATVVAIDSSLASAEALLEVMTQDRVIESPEDLANVAGTHSEYVSALQSARTKIGGE